MYGLVTRYGPQSVAQRKLVNRPGTWNAFDAAYRRCALENEKLEKCSCNRVEAKGEERVFEPFDKLQRRVRFSKEVTYQDQGTCERIFKNEIGKPDFQGK